MKKALFLFLFAVLYLVISPIDARAAQDTTSCPSQSLNMMRDTWRAFRQLHPLPLHTVGLKHCGDTCVFVISEPPRWVDANQFGDLFASRGGHAIVCSKPFGFDGCLRDVVGCVRLDSISFPAFQHELFVMLYGTDYKPFYTNLDKPEVHTYFSSENLNYSLETLDWDGWCRSEMFITEQGETLRWDDIISVDKPTTNELYFSQKRGFVLWRIDNCRVSHLDESFRVNARRFALDSDLILHSVQIDSFVVVIARERLTSVHILPPLRSETLMQIAFAQHSPSLSLNAEKADSIDDAGVWHTPLDMSSGLKNTEQGNLMFICDLILKSWSENGRKEDSFIQYPKPKEYPLANGVASQLGSVPTYLWFSACKTTGSLFPLYIPQKKKPQLVDANLTLSQQKFFAQQNNTDLVRLVQYTMLNSAFSSLQDSCWQADADSARWIMTPSASVSNEKWGHGGFIGARTLPMVVSQNPVKVARGVGKASRTTGNAVRRSVPKVANPKILPKVRNGNAAAIVTGSSSIVSRSPRTGVSSFSLQPLVLPNALSANNKLLSTHILKDLLPKIFLSDPHLHDVRTSLQLQDGLADERGFIPGVHDAVQTQPEVQEHYPEDEELLEKTRNELRMKILRLKGKLNAIDVQNDVTIIAMITIYSPQSDLDYAA
ncbi:MAG: hypothetical protein KBT39_08055 [Bacteroidales bacterium]|nr:hypothetical protein [Bacteroidales bacterium]